MVSTITFNENIRNVRGTHTTYKFPASALVNLHDSGFFDDWDPKHSFLIMNYRSPFSNNMYLSKILGVPIKTCYVNDPKVFEACIENYSRASLVPFVFNFNLDTNGEPIFALLCEVRSEDIGNGILANFYPKEKDCQFSDPMGRSTFKSLQNDLSHLNLQKLLISPFMLDYPEIALSYVDVFRDQIVVKGTHFPASSDNGIIAWVTDEVHLNAFLKNTEIFRRRICFDLIRPSNTPIKVKVELMYVASEEIEFLGVKNLCFDLKKSNNLLKVNALSPLEPVNTDPRNIRFGIANWMVQSTDVVVE